MRFTPRQNHVARCESGVRACVAPAVYRRALETQVNVDEAAPLELEGKVLKLIWSNASGQAPMDLGFVDGGQQQEDRE